MCIKECARDQPCQSSDNLSSYTLRAFLQEGRGKPQDSQGYGGSRSPGKQRQVWACDQMVTTQDTRWDKDSQVNGRFARLWAAPGQADCKSLAPSITLFPQASLLSYPYFSRTKEEEGSPKSVASNGRHGGVPRVTGVDRHVRKQRECSLPGSLLS